MVRRIEMRAVVRADGDALHCCIFAVGQLIDTDAHVLRHCRRGQVVIEVLDLRQRCAADRS